MRSKHAGFTVIELIVVIVILGILTATALPKFIDVSDEAQKSALAGVAGAAASAHAANYGGCVATSHVVTADKCVAISDCGGTPSIMQGGLPAGYTIAAAAIGSGTAGANNDGATCTLTQTRTGYSGTFTGISAGL